jgi:hypothetical protein
MTPNSTAIPDAVAAVEQVVGEDVQCDDEVVETGAHEALPRSTLR